MGHVPGPVSKYEQLAPQFNPVRFNADEWVEIAGDAGMKYIVITARHCDEYSLGQVDLPGPGVFTSTP